MSVKCRLRPSARPTYRRLLSTHTPSVGKTPHFKCSKAITASQCWCCLLKTYCVSTQNMSILCLPSSNMICLSHPVILITPLPEKNGDASCKWYVEAEASRSLTGPPLQLDSLLFGYFFPVRRSIFNYWRSPACHCFPDSLLAFLSDSLPVRISGIVLTRVCCWSAR